MSWMSCFPPQIQTFPQTPDFLTLHLSTHTFYRLCQKFKMQLAGQVRASRKRAWRACQRCHARKVRCDGVVNGFPCTNCRLDHFDCAPWAGPRNGALVKESVRPTLNDEAAQTVRHLQHNFRASRYRRYSNTKSNCGVSDAVFPNAICGTTDLCLSGYVLSSISLPFSFYPFIKARLRQLNPAQVAFLASQGCLHLPTKSMTDMFVHSYFLYVHPFLPLLDEATFWQEYRLVSVHGDGISILLFYAMIFAASCVGKYLDHRNMI